jgi:hypothetical protein
MPSGEVPFVTAESSQVDAACTIFPPVQGAAFRSEFEAGDAQTRPHREGSELVVVSPEAADCAWVRNARGLSDSARIDVHFTIARGSVYAQLQPREAPGSWRRPEGCLSLRFIGVWVLGK